MTDAMEERAKIVRYLRNIGTEWVTPGVCAFVGDPFGYDGQAMCRDLADAIERGDHDYVDIPRLKLGKQ